MNHRDKQLNSKSGKNGPVTKRGTIRQLKIVKTLI